MMANFSADKGFFAPEPAFADAGLDVPVAGGLAGTGALGDGPVTGVKETLAESAVFDLSGEFGCAFMQWMCRGFWHGVERRRTEAQKRVQYRIRLHTINT